MTETKILTEFLFRTGAYYLRSQTGNIESHRVKEFAVPFFPHRESVVYLLGNTFKNYLIYYFPIRVANSTDVLITHKIRSIHMPYKDISSELVSPEDVRVAVAVEVADAFDFPIEVIANGPDILVRDEGGSVHEPYKDISSELVSPEDVRVAV
ncbi:MAG: hypothetical protein NTY64_18995, partial [Deltaproteobacteria bacterium]|nr:hypothetical protein [Deltaproteobacteria bacterium]